MSTPRRVVLVGIGGASSSGKTTLARLLKSILPHALILHQDDFAPVPEEIPLNAQHNVPDWDAPPTAIRWTGFREAITYLKQHGTLPPGLPAREKEDQRVENDKHATLPPELREVWRQRLARADVQYQLVDGFLAYYDPQVYEQYDVRLLVRSDYATIKARRAARGGYAVTSSTSAEAHGHEAVDGDREFWVDPPNYFEDIVWPAYRDAHAAYFENRDVEHGCSIRPELAVIEGDSLEEVFVQACTRIESVLH